MFIFNLFRAAFFSALQVLACLFRRFLFLNPIRLHDAWTTYDKRAETKEERKRMTTTKQYTSNSSKLGEEFTTQSLFLNTKQFVVFTDTLFQVDEYF